MDRKMLTDYILTNYNTSEEYPWIKYPKYSIFRCGSTKKWFVAMLSVPATKLGIDSEEILDIINIKIEPILKNSLLEKKEFYPAYHMNKTHWITVVISFVDNDDVEYVEMLIDESYNLVAIK